MADKKPVAPCLGCEERSARCHAACPRYLHYRAQMDERRARRLRLYAVIDARKAARRAGRK